MAARWLQTLERLCDEARRRAPTPYSTEVVLFYLARWCQKKTRAAAPRVGELDRATLGAVAERIARNLASDGALVDSLVAGDAAALTELRRALRESAVPRVGARAYDFAEEALQKIAVVLLTGTPPSRAADELRRGPEGPRNEYVFESPFSSWARTVVINLIRDDWRRAMRRGHVEGSHQPPVDREVVARARAALPELLEAIRKLPPKQRSVMVLSLARRDLDETVRDGLHDLAPDLFSDAAGIVASDDDIATLLDTTRHRVAANRSAARRKLVKRDQSWELLLDLFLPHRTTRPLEAEPDA